ncbi:MAG: hypothetical protein RDU01_02725 [Thermodesulfovibrionales bacterium]|nr:hypothetical protein [Thermodesulfovibrionales bacterium]
MEQRKSMTIKIIIVFGFLLSIVFMFSVPLHATDWNFVTTTTKNYYFIDSDSIITNYTAITFWVIKMDISTAKVRAKKRCTINCHFETALVQEDIRYDAEGHITKIMSDNDIHWYDIRKGSATKAIANLLCEDGGSKIDIKKHLKQPFQIKENEMVSFINNLNSANRYFNSQ